MYLLEDYDYALPEKLIAQKPSLQRDRSKLLCLDRKTGSVVHRIFNEIAGLLSGTDLVVVNNTAVIPARLFGEKTTGGRVEVLLLDGLSTPDRPLDPGPRICHCLLSASKAPKPNTSIHFGEEIVARVIGNRNGIYRLEFSANEDFEDRIRRIGRVPLPPYIKRHPNHDDPHDREAYQTVYASRPGAVAAPTAGLHFTPPLLDEIAEKGIGIAQITLHVGCGTFLPVKSHDIRDHRMHPEWYCISGETADLINRTKAGGGRIVAVGTTCVRALEHAAQPGGLVAAGSRTCDLYIYPGYGFKVTDALITNFHLPKSTLLMLVCAFAQRSRILRAYAEAVERGYRFYSYGDAMYIA